MTTSDLNRASSPDGNEVGRTLPQATTAARATSRWWRIFGCRWPRARRN